MAVMRKWRLFLADTAICKAECCDRDTGTCSQHPMQNAWLQKAALSFLNVVYSIWGAKRREFISTVKNHIPSNYKDAEILHTGSCTQPRIDFSLQLSSHGVLVISFCSLLLEDIYNTAVLTFLFNRNPLDKATWSLFFI